MDRSHLAETVLATLAGSESDRRTVVVLARQRTGRLVVELREQHHAAGIGWFDQKAIRLETAQIEALAELLGGPKATPSWREEMRRSEEEVARDEPVTLSFAQANRKPFKPRGRSGSGGVVRAAVNF